MPEVLVNLNWFRTCYYNDLNRGSFHLNRLMDRLPAWEPWCPVLVHSPGRWRTRVRCRLRFRFRFWSSPGARKQRRAEGVTDMKLGWRCANSTKSCQRKNKAASKGDTWSTCKWLFSCICWAAFEPVDCQVFISACLDQLLIEGMRKRNKYCVFFVTAPSCLYVGL